MSFKYGFYDSMNGDRKYGANDFAHIFDGIIQDGVFATIGRSMIVTAGSGMSVIVGSGKAWFDHTWSWLTADMPLDISAASSAYSRYDAVVLETNDETRVNEIKVIAGTPAASPVKPSLTPRQHCLAYINVPAAATSITAANIEIVVGTSATPFVTGMLQLLNLDAVIMQKTPVWESEFREWFTHLRNELDSNQAANLQRQIDELDAFHVGDLLTTRATDLDDGWLLANGQYYPVSAYPDVLGVFPVVSYQHLESHHGAGLISSIHQSHILNGNMVTAIRNNTSGDFDSKIYVCGIVNGVPRSVVRSFVLGHSGQDGRDESVGPKIAFDEIRRKYITLERYGDYYTSIYERPEDIYAENWPSTYLGTFPIHRTGENYALIHDFLWWKGYYFVLVSTDAGTHVYRAADVTGGEWVDLGAVSGKRFSVIDDRLTVFIGGASRQASKWNLTASLSVLSYPTGAFVKSTYTQQDIGTELHGFGGDLVKVGEDYFAGGYKISVQGLQIVGVSKVADIIKGDATYTPQFFAETNGDFLMGATTSAAYCVLRQKKAEHPGLNLTDPTVWEVSTLGAFGYDASQGVVQETTGQCAPLIFDLDGHHVGVTVQGLNSSAYNVQNVPYLYEAFGIPTIPATVDGFSNYIKVKKGRY